MDEAEFDAEFDRLVQEKEACPICSRGPVNLGALHDNDEVMLYAICEIGHMYVVEDDGAD